jgi:nucleoside-diphosphate-sugar epimerase
VTGGTGLLGWSVLERLAEDEDVVALCRPGSGPPEMKGVSWIEQDLAEPLREDLPRRVEAVLHLAQSRRHRDFPAGASDTFAVNAMATVRLLDYCRQAEGRRFVYASSGAVYRPGPEPLREADPPDPASFYGGVKLAAERAVGSFADWFETEILRFFFVYGPRQAVGAFIPAIAERVRSGTAIELRGPDGMRCNPIYVDEAAAAVVAARSGDGSAIVNVAGPEVLSLRQIGELVGGLLGVKPTFAESPGEGDLIADIGLMRERLIAPRVAPAEGLARMLTQR